MATVQEYSSDCVSILKLLAPGLNQSCKLIACLVAEESSRSPVLCTETISIGVIIVWTSLQTFFHGTYTGHALLHVNGFLV